MRLAELGRTFSGNEYEIPPIPYWSLRSSTVMESVPCSRPLLTIMPLNKRRSNAKQSGLSIPLHEDLSIGTLKAILNNEKCGVLEIAAAFLITFVLDAVFCDFRLGRFTFRICSALWHILCFQNSQLTFAQHQDKHRFDSCNADWLAVAGNALT